MPENSPAPVNTDVRYEKSDARIGGIIAFGVMLGVLGLIAQASVVWLFDGLKESENRKYPPLSTLAARERVRLPGDLKEIPRPRLQESETLDLARLRQAEESLLKSYGWEVRKDGAPRIPDEVIRLLTDPKLAAEKGVRVRPLKEN